METSSQLGDVHAQPCATPQTTELDRWSQCVRKCRA